QVVAARDASGSAGPAEPADAVVGADERERVRAALAVLPERQATALLLRHAGHSYRETATALGVAEGSVGVLLARGGRAFRRAHEEMPRGPAAPTPPSCARTSTTRTRRSTPTSTPASPAPACCTRSPRTP